MTPLRDIVEALLSWPKWDSRSYWLAEMVVRVVEERAEKLAAGCPNSHLDEALCDFDITLKDFAWLKGKVG